MSGERQSTDAACKTEHKHGAGGPAPARCQLSAVLHAPLVRPAEESQVVSSDTALHHLLTGNAAMFSVRRAASKLTKTCICKLRQHPKAAGNR